ncbi:hypothetical protein FRY74_06195 [Vicingus serpentipes]|uniref:Uncharacterized protein n=1 Tax=Vicingus serpentipes TaxID=1926625 RepID=A0A5C6RX29_9FLAO|nr:hypothetical protein [Vicingus serpentipes]TXB66160.1 hypothetical protein FRY74_06195 [Vicingus serpentipes]
MLEKLDYKNNHHYLLIEGNFKDSNESFFYISQKQVFHVTFVKVGKQVEEWIRKLIIVDGMDEFFISEVEFKYVSNYKTMGGARNFISKQLDYLKYKDIINEHIKSINDLSKFKTKTGRNYDFDSPF